MESIGDNAIKIILIIGAIAILGGVVVPRLSGWIFNPKSSSFVWVWYAGVFTANLWYFQKLRNDGEEMSPYGYVVFAVLYGVGTIILMTKDKDEDPFKE